MEGNNDDEQNHWQSLCKVTARLLSEPSKFTAHLRNCGSEYRSSLFLCSEGTKADASPRLADFGIPISVLTPVDSLNARGRPPLTVEGVLLKSSLSKIGDPVVRLHAVDVVNQLRGPATVYQQPSEAMGGISHAINANYSVSKPDGTSPHSTKSRVCQMGPNKFTGIRRIVQEFADSFKRDKIIEATHDSKPHKQNEEQPERNEDASRAYVEQRLRDLAAFERRFDKGRGGVRPPRK